MNSAFKQPDWPDHGGRQTQAETGDTGGTGGARLSRRALLQAAVVGACAIGLTGPAAAPAAVAAVAAARKGLLGRRRSPWFTALDADRARCELCPRHCELDPGQRGSCRVRENRAGAIETLVFGNPALVQTDPVERKPFFHVLPGTRALSVSTAGCNLACKYCEVWDMALSAPEEVYAYAMPPEAIIAQARDSGVQSISYAFGEPVVYAEYVAAIAERAREAGMLNLLHSNGYIAAEPCRTLAGLLDAVNIDLKAFDDGFYRRVCDGELQPVLDTLLRLRQAGLHLEITNIVIPTLNDDPELIRRMSRWIRDRLGADTPLHLGRFYPLYRLSNLPATPVATLDRAREIALESGLRYVYVARVTGHQGEHTYCPGCGAKVISRLGFMVEENRLNEGRCDRCGTAVAGRWKT